MQVLLTGFEPYWDHPVNSSWVVAEKVAAYGVIGVDIAVEQMPVSFFRVGVALREAVEKHSPDMIIMLGQSGGSDKVKLERVALNLMDSRLPDNDGCTPDEEPISSDAPPALFATVPVKPLCRTIGEQGVNVKISNSCGLYVCNRLYYEALMLCREHPLMKAIFVHLPFYEGQPSVRPDKPAMLLDDMVKAIQIIIEENNDKSREIQEAACAGVR